MGHDVAVIDDELVDGYQELIADLLGVAVDEVDPGLQDKLLVPVGQQGFPEGLGVVLEVA
jgi:hypothetical protein